MKLRDTFANSATQTDSVNTVPIPMVAGTVHVVVDIQRGFCDPSYLSRATKETLEAAEKLADVIPQIRDQGVLTYLVYSDTAYEGPEEASGGFHLIEPHETDIPIGKDKHSAFEGGNIEENLQYDGAQRLIISGVNKSVCVRDTVLDALAAGYEVWVLEDCLGDDKFTQLINSGKADPDDAVKQMQEAGAVFISSDDAIEQLKALNAQEAALQNQGAQAPAQPGTPTQVG